MKTILLYLLSFYRYAIRPVMASHCRFYPSCSCYSQEAIEKHGAFWGSVLTAKRLCKCHPFHEGGLDPVPEQRPSLPKNLFKIRQL